MGRTGLRYPTANATPAASATARCGAASARASQRAIDWIRTTHFGPGAECCCRRGGRQNENASDEGRAYRSDPHDAH